MYPIFFNQFRFIPLSWCGWWPVSIHFPDPKWQAKQMNELYKVGGVDRWLLSTSQNIIEDHISTHVFHLVFVWGNLSGCWWWRNPANLLLIRDIVNIFIKSPFSWLALDDFAQEKVWFLPSTVSVCILGILAVRSAWTRRISLPQGSRHPLSNLRRPGTKKRNESCKKKHSNMGPKSRLRKWNDNGPLINAPK